jgi:SOS response associated peptidase (SRAP)
VWSCHSKIWAVSDSRLGNVPRRYNAAPSQELLVIRENHRTGERSLDLIKWGLTPYWCKDPRGGRKPINAKAESVSRLPMFRDAYAQRRCIVPVDGFFEWRAIMGGRESRESLAKWIEANASAEACIQRNASTEQLIAYHLQNYRQPNAYRAMADALESFRGPRPWAKLLNKLSKKHDPRKMQQRYFSVREVDRLLQSYVDCDCREKFVRPVLDEVGIRLVSGEINPADRAWIKSPLLTV